MNAESSGFKIERCVNLHNELVRIGWEGSGQSFEKSGLETRREIYVAQCNNEQGLTPLFTLGFVAFLRGALYPDGDRTRVFLSESVLLYQGSGDTTDFLPRDSCCSRTG